MGLIASRKTDRWDWAECRENQVLPTVTKPATDDAGEGDDYRTIGPSCAGTVAAWRDWHGRGTWSMMVQILSISLVLNFALTEVLVPQWGALTGWLAGETWRLNKCSHRNCVKIQLTVDSALSPVLKVLNTASELGTTEKHENYSRPVSNDRSCHTQWMDSAVPWVKSVGKLTQSMNGERSSSFSAI